MLKVIPKIIYTSNFYMGNIQLRSWLCFTTRFMNLVTYAAVVNCCLCSDIIIQFSNAKINQFPDSSRIVWDDKQAQSSTMGPGFKPQGRLLLRSLGTIFYRKVLEFGTLLTLFRLSITKAQSAFRTSPGVTCTDSQDWNLLVIKGFPMKQAAHL